jgi:hypothetical protein
MSDWLKIIGGLIVVALIWFVAPKFTATPQKKAVAAAQGWDDLAACSELASFDGKRTLSLWSDGTATIEEKTGAERSKIKAKWRPGNRPGMYSLELEDKQLHYERVAPESWDSCILAAGTSLVANLQASWFAFQLDDLARDR